MGYRGNVLVGVGVGGGGWGNGVRRLLRPNSFHNSVIKKPALEV